MSDYLSPYDVGKPVKVTVGHRDGEQWLEAYTDDMAKAGMPYVETDQHTWAQWQAHCAAARAWNSYCTALSNKLFEKENPESQ
jgi:hypothetical protein